jgi:hypothetical protein
MCGRYLIPNQAAIERHYHLGRGENNPFPTRYNGWRVIHQGFYDRI